MALLLFIIIFTAIPVERNHANYRAFILTTALILFLLMVAPTLLSAAILVTALIAVLHLIKEQ